MMQLDAWNNARRILCVRLDALGDVLMTTPAIRALKETHPGRRITLLTSPAGAEAAALIPEIDDVLVYDAPWMKATRPRNSSQTEWVMAERLRQGCASRPLFVRHSEATRVSCTEKSECPLFHSARHKHFVIFRDRDGILL
jgi:hypothetical protein